MMISPVLRHRLLRDRLARGKAVLVWIKCAARGNLRAIADPNVADERSELAVWLNVCACADLDTAVLADFDDCVGFDERAIANVTCPPSPRS